MSSVYKGTDVVRPGAREAAFVLPTDRPELLARRDLRDEQEDDVGLSPEERAARIMAEARREADRILAEARAEAEAIRRRAREEGREEGQRAGMEQAMSEYEDVLGIMTRMADAIVSKADALVRASERDIARLAVAVAGKVIQRSVEQDPEIVLAIARAAISQTEGTRSVVLRVSPKDMELVLLAHDELVKSSPDLRNLKVVEDPRIERGGCVVEMEVGHVDARIDEQLSEIERVFMEEAEYAG
ncbi:MAG: FliH/SctL family protein [Bacillota bacterium]